MKIKLISGFILLAIATKLLAQDISFVASAPKYVRVGEQFQIQYTIDKNVDDFTPPDFDGFDYLGGPMQSTSSSTNIINGKVTRSTTFTLIYYLRAKSPGKYTIKPARSSYKKDQVSSNAVDIEVVGTATSQQPQSNTTQQSSGTATSTGDDIFVSLVLDKKTAYVGQQITAWVKVYTKVDLNDIDRRSYKGPEFNGFFKQNIEIPPLRNLEREKVGDEIYYSGVIEKFIISPQRTGKISINPFDLTVLLKKQARQPQSIFDDFFGPSYSSVPKKLTSKSVTVNVKPLPENQPAEFSGAVGSYSIKGSINTNKVNVNEAIQFKIVVSGQGNIRLIEKLNYDLSFFDVFDPVVNSNVDNSGLGGTKVFEITAIPRHAGTFSIDPFSLTYFDINSKSYKTLKTQTFDLIVDKGDADTSSIIITNIAKEDVELLSSDIRYIKTNSKFKPSHNYLIAQFRYYIIYIILLTASSLILIFKRKQIKNNADIVRTRNKKASKVAKKRLKKALSLLKANEKENFFEELSRALWGYFSDKLNIPVSNLSAEKAKASLMNKNIDNQIVDDMLKVISDCEFARYAPGGFDRSLKEVYDEAAKFITIIDQKL
ncbi:MAG: protein BatD [Bacteroidales bacterium]|nr:protein BatD [Bacteroidales bacterium]MBN2820154.1 protein BatD [Bacteroidales bacterium]